jgi:hypothetical protein
MRRDGSVYWSHSVKGEGNRGFYLAATDQVVTLFPANHTYSSRAPMIWRDRPFRRSRDGASSECSAPAFSCGAVNFKTLINVLPPLFSAGRKSASASRAAG